MGHYGDHFGGNFDLVKIREDIKKNIPIEPEIGNILIDKIDNLESQLKNQTKHDKIYLIIGIICSALLGYGLGKFI